MSDKELEELVEVVKNELGSTNAQAFIDKEFEDLRLAMRVSIAEGVLYEVLWSALQRNYGTLQDKLNFGLGEWIK